MYKSNDFNLDSKEFRFKKDSYPLSKINNVRVKKLSFLDNLGQVLFWVCVFFRGSLVSYSKVGRGATMATSFSS